MDIYMIWARDTKYNHMWLLDAWDEDSIDGNYTGWQEALARHKEIEQEENMVVRVVKAPVDFEGVRAAFEVPTVAFGRVEAVED